MMMMMTLKKLSLVLDLACKNCFVLTEFIPFFVNLPTFRQFGEAEPFVSVFPL